MDATQTKSKLATELGQEFTRYFRHLASRVEKAVRSLPREKLWNKPFPYGNSVGHLVLHMTGNLNYYIGAQVAETGYVRDRDREFTEPEPKPKDEVLAAFDRAIQMVIDTIEKQAPEDWLKRYSAVREAESKERFAIFLRCAGHAYHHVGQIVYLSRELTK